MTVIFKIIISILAVLLLVVSKVNAQPMLSKQFTGVVATDAGVSAGIAWGDFNNDYYEDLFVTNWSNQNNYLYKNNGDGTFTKLTDGAIVNDGGFSSSASWGDYDNDGYLDLYVTNQQNQNNFLYRNNGDETFTKVTTGDIVNDFGDSYSSAWADYNNDSYPDLYVANFGQPNFLYLNNGDGTFTNMKESVPSNGADGTFGVSWCDFDNDGWQDIFVANRGVENNALYLNNKNSTFTKITNSPIVNDSSNSNGGSWADIDNDGDMDLLVTNGAFFQKGQHDLLYINNGNGTFMLDTSTVISKDSAKSMSACWADFDTDGDLDVYVTQYVHDDLFFENNGDGTFIKRTDNFVTQIAGFGTGLGSADYNNDGRPDLMVACWENQNNVLMRSIPNENNWLKVKCIGSESNKFGLGSNITLETSENNITTVQTRQITSNSGFRSQSSMIENFGITVESKITKLTVRWPSGIIDTLVDLDPNQYITIKEGVGLTSSLKPESVVVKKSAYTEVSQIIKDHGLDSGITHYQFLYEEKSDEYSFDEAQFNYYGYLLLGEQKYDDAIRILKLNNKTFSNSLNTYDSLADAYVKIGNNELAIELSKKIVEMVDTEIVEQNDANNLLKNSSLYRLKHMISKK